MKMPTVALVILAGLCLAARCQGADGAETLRAEFHETKAKAERGAAVAQSKFCFMCKKGQGVEKDYAQAVKWYRKAVDQGYARAQYNLGAIVVLTRTPAGI